MTPVELIEQQIAESPHSRVPRFRMASRTRAALPMSRPLESVIYRFVPEFERFRIKMGDRTDNMLRFPIVERRQPLAPTSSIFDRGFRLVDGRDKRREPAATAVDVIDRHADSPPSAAIALAASTSSVIQLIWFPLPPCACSTS